jgi:hypothetical protein
VRQQDEQAIRLHTSDVVARAHEMKAACGAGFG